LFKDKEDQSGAQTLQRQDKAQRLQIPEVDIRMLDMIMQDGTEGTDI
jgi:hypothetical protein